MAPFCITLLHKATLASLYHTFLMFRIIHTKELYLSDLSV
jgi:hypothetical protein